MSDNFREEWFKLVLENLKDNSDKLQEMQDQYYQLRSSFDKHHILDTKIHEEIKGFIVETNRRLDMYNKQLEIHIEGTNTNRLELREFKKSIHPLLEQYVEEQAVKKANMRLIKKWSAYLGILGAVIGIITGILGLLDIF
jgi:hypothetical protein